jgi:hypothetical protein
VSGLELSRSPDQLRLPLAVVSSPEAYGEEAGSRMVRVAEKLGPSLQLTARSSRVRGAAKTGDARRARRVDEVDATG